MKRRDFLNNFLGGCFGGSILPFFGLPTSKKKSLDEPKIHIEEMPKPKVISNLNVILTDSTIMNCSFINCGFRPLTDGYVFCNAIDTTIERKVKSITQDICFENCMVDIREASFINCFIDPIRYAEFSGSVCGTHGG